MDDSYDGGYGSKSRRARSSAPGFVLLLIIAASLIYFGLPEGVRLRAGSAPEAAVATLAAAAPVVPDAAAAAAVPDASAQAELLAARQEADQAQRTLAEAQLALRQAQAGLQAANAREATLAARIQDLEVDLARTRDFFLILLEVLVVLFILAVLTWEILQRRRKDLRTAKLAELQARERQLRGEMSRMRTMYHESLQTVRSQLEDAHSQQAQARTELDRRPSQPYAPATNPYRTVDAPGIQR